MAIDVSGAIVVGYDASEQGKAAVDWAAAEAHRRNTHLVVVHAFRRPERGADKEALKRGEEMADRIAEEGAALARESVPGLRVEATARRKGAAAALQELSQDAALVVVGNRGRGRLGVSLLGSVASAISAHAEIPVVIVRGRSANLPSPEYPVVVGTDGSDLAGKAVTRAGDVAADTGARLIIAAGWQAPEGNPWAPGYLANVHADQQAAEAAEQVARDNVTRAQDEVRRRHPDLEVQAGTQRGRAEHVLSDATDGAGLLVVGARGHSDLVGLLLGSVSRAVMYSAHCPVTVVR